MEIELITSTGRLLEIQADWENLITRSSANDFFLLPIWVLNWWETNKQGKSLFVVAFWGKKHLNALFPLYKKSGFTGTLRMLGQPEISDRTDFIIRKGYEEIHIQAFIQWLFAQKGWKVLELREFGPFSENSKILKNLLARENTSFLTYKETPNYYINVQKYKNFQEYFETEMTKSRKRSFHRNIKRLSRQKEIEWEILTEVTDTDEFIKKLIRELAELECQRSFRGMKGQCFFKKTSNIHFMAETLPALFSQRKVVLFTLKINGKLAAYTLTFTHNNKLLGYQMAFDHQWSKLGLGTLSMYKSIQYCFDKKIKEYDFLAGGEPYKMHFTKTYRQNDRFIIFGPTIGSRFQLFYYKTIKPIKSKLKNIIKK